MRIDLWRKVVQRLKVDTYTLYLASRHPDVPWYAKLVAAGVVAYIFSPIDLIPDVIPVLGYLDDLLLVPAGIALALRLIPANILEACRTTARSHVDQEKPTNWAAAVVIIGIWLLLAAIVARLVIR